MLFSEGRESGPRRRTYRDVISELRRLVRCSACAPSVSLVLDARSGSAMSPRKRHHGWYGGGGDGTRFNGQAGLASESVYAGVGADNSTASCSRRRAAFIEGRAAGSCCQQSSTRRHIASVHSSTAGRAGLCPRTTLSMAVS
jgi:hypothetical protein